jgi:outer membrane protein TolC
MRFVLATTLLLAPLCPPSAGADPLTLTLDESITAASKSNRELIQARTRVEEVQRGSRIIVRSRYLPHLSLTTTYDVEPSATNPSGRTEEEFGSRVEYAQRLFEFGPNATQEIGLRADLRQALFSYQDKLHQVQARVWQLFHLVLLQEEQVHVRRQSRSIFMLTLERQQALFDERMASEEDRLNAELNVLNEDLAINRLVRQQFSNKMELLRRNRPLPRRPGRGRRHRHGTQC